jgi:tetratricopeptide (TPR) repeat protein
MMAGVGFEWMLDADGQARVLGASQRRAEVAGTHPYDWAIEHTYLYELRGEPAKARAWADTARRLATAALTKDPRSLWATVALGTAKGYLGQRDDALHDLARAASLAETTTDRYGVQYQVARVHLATGDREGAVQALQTALDMPTPWLTREALAVDPTWSSLHDLASFQRLVAPPKGKG